MHKSSLNTVLMQGYDIKLVYSDAMMDFVRSTAGTDHGMTNEEWRAKRQSLKGHYFWTAVIISHGGQKHMPFKGPDIGPNDSPEFAMVKFMRGVGVGLAGMAKADAKELVPEIMPP